MLSSAWSVLSSQASGLAGDLERGLQGGLCVACIGQEGASRLWAGLGPLKLMAHKEFV